MDKTPDELSKELNALLGSIQAVPESSRKAKDASEERDFEAEHLKFDLEVRQEKKKFRAKWQRILRILVVLGFITSYVLIILIGMGILNFDQVAVPAVVAAGALQTYGLARLAVGFTFSVDPKPGTPKSAKK